MEVSLSKKSWHYKLQTWVFGEAPDLFSLCPYFWLTVFCVFASPFIYLFRGVFGGIGELLTFIDEAYLLPKFEKWLDNADNDTLYDIVQDNKVRTPITFKYLLYDRWNRGELLRSKLRNKHNDYYEFKRTVETKKHEWMFRPSEVVVKVHKEPSKFEAYVSTLFDKVWSVIDKVIEKLSKPIKVTWQSIVLWTRRITNVFITIGIMWLSSWLVVILVATVNFGELLFVGKIFLYIIGSILLGIIIITPIVLIVKYYVDSGKLPLVLAVPFSMLSMFFVKLWGGLTYLYDVFKALGTRLLKSTFGILFEYFKAAKNDYCPAINWDEQLRD